MTEIDNIRGLDRLTENAVNLLKASSELARKYNQDQILVVHIFHEQLKNQKALVKELINRIGIDAAQTMKRIEDQLDLLSKSKIAAVAETGEVEVLNGDLKLSDQVKTLINEAFTVASELNQVYVGTEHLFMAMFRMNDLQFVEDLKLSGINYAFLKNIVVSLGNYSMLESAGGADDFFGGNFFGKGQQQQPTYYRDMNQLALDGAYPNISGRDAEIKRMIHILSRKTKNNPILVGDAGVGKTAIVEGFVNQLINKQLPSSFHDKIVISLDVGSIIAGAKLRGDVEERIQNVIQQAVVDGNTIIFIDEIHNIIGAGSAGGKDSMDIANLLKPYLTNSEITVIGATTRDEYNKYFESDPALNRRFQPVNVEELDMESAITVINNLKDDFESYHKVKIKDEAIEDAVKLTHQFIKDRYLPDKAIDVIDEAAASIKIGREIAIEPELSELGNKLIKIGEAKDAAFKNKNLERAATIKEKEADVIKEIAKIIEGKKSVKKHYPKTVTSELVKQIIVDWTKIPIAASNITDKTLKDLKKKLLERVIGQDHVIENVAVAVQRSHLGFGDEKKPLGSFLFLGPTGVGKSELAKSIAKELFGSKDLIYQIDMSEMMESHSVSKLIGSPPGYVGFSEGGQLTNFVKRKPYSVVLFDEIEKAHPDTLNLLLQILEEGHLTDGQGRTVSFSNTIVIMTSNIGAEKVSTDSRIGFDVEVADEKEVLERAFDEMKEKILEQLRNTVRPEILNRIDLIDVFRGLNKEDCLKITKIIIDELKIRLLGKGLILDVDEEIVKMISEKGYSKEYGARNLKRKVQELLENSLAMFLINSHYKNNSKTVMNVEAKLKDSEVKFEVK